MLFPFRVASMPAVRYDLSGGLPTCLLLFIYQDYSVICIFKKLMWSWYGTCIFLLNKFCLSLSVWVWIQGERSTMEPGDQTLQDQNITIHNSIHNVNWFRTKSYITNEETLMSRNPTPPKSIDELNCVFLNADTLTNKLSELHLQTKTERPHIIGINEVLPKNHNRQIHPEEFILDGYEMIIHPNVNKNTGRGTLLYVHNTISHKQISISPDNEEFQEALFTEIKLNAKDNSCVHACTGEENQTLKIIISCSKLSVQYQIRSTVTFL